MSLKKILNILIFFTILFNTFGCLSSHANADIEAQKRATREKIDRLKWLESLETNKLYKNQQKLEAATNNLSTSKSKIVSAQNELYGLEAKLEKASAEYNQLNYKLSSHIRNVYKNQRKAFFEILLNSKDINMLGDRLYYQKLILKEDYNKMAQARAKAQEIRDIRNNIIARKRSLERSVASINSQQVYIKQAIKKNEDMIIYTDILFSEASAYDENGNEKKDFIPKYPNERLLLEQIGSIDELVVGGYHVMACVKRVAEEALNLGIDALVDLDMTDLFFNVYKQKDYFDIENYSPERFKTNMISKFGDRHIELEERLFNRNYSSPVYGFTKEVNKKR